LTAEGTSPSLFSMKVCRLIPLLLIALIALPLQAAKKVVLDAQIEAAIEEFFELSPAGKNLVKKAEGMLVFPSVKKAGFGIGGEFGEGALLVDGKIVQYYNTVAASIGFQMGVQVKRQIIIFLEKSALKNFRTSEGWEVGVDGSVAIATLGAGGEIESKVLNQPVVGFIFGNKGLMYNLSLEGSKITPIEK
jgi:lipid-binding SYLF domain-containing protein